MEFSGFGFPPGFFPPDGLANESDDEGEGSAVPADEGDGSAVTTSEIGSLVTEKTSFSTGVSFSTGELVGSFVTVIVGDGLGGLLLSLHSGDQIALSVQ